VSGSPAFVFRDPASGEIVRLEPEPGDYVWVPPHVPHREENRSPDAAAVVVIARPTQEPSSSTSAASEGRLRWRSGPTTASVS
jgi:oxalate decarboxylase/phosphoglucose isomerase-like protein (cupin superfamily)